MGNSVRGMADAALRNAASPLPCTGFQHGAGINGMFKSEKFNEKKFLIYFQKEGIDVA